MALFLQQVVNGLLLGGMFALMSIGLSMVFGIMKTANFAYGALYMVGGYAAYWSSTLLHAPYLVAVLLAFILMFVAGVLVEVIGFRPLRENEDATLIFGLGLALVIHGGAILAWGSQNRYIAMPGAQSLTVGPFIFASARLYAGYREPYHLGRDLYLGVAHAMGAHHPGGRG
jgi:branched-chain amino acid transport system permease protein